MPLPYYHDWLHLSSHLLWCYDRALDWPKANTDQRRNSGAWLVRNGWAEVEHDGCVTRAEPGQWLIPKPVARRQTFGRDTHLLSIAFEARWADHSPWICDGLSRMLDADACPALEQRARPMLQIADRVTAQTWDMRACRMARTDFLQLEAALGRWLEALTDALTADGLVLAAAVPVDARVEHALELIHALPWDQPLDRRALAAEVGCSPTHLARLFRRDVGCPPKACWDRLRLEHACRRLSQPDTRVQEVADELGFGSPSYFSTWFRKATGCAPRAYARDHADGRV